MIDKKIDIADFHITGDYAATKTAGIIGQYLCAKINIDDLISDTDPNTDWIKCSAGCGNAEFYLNFPTATHALAALSSCLTGYHLQDYHHLYIGPEDYKLLKEFVENTWIRPPSVYAAFESFLRAFCVAYSDIDKRYLLELLK
jgi:hypothetical protein